MYHSLVKLIKYFNGSENILVILKAKRAQNFWTILKKNNHCEYEGGLNLTFSMGNFECH